MSYKSLKDRIYEAAMKVYFRYEKTRGVAGFNLAGYRLMANLSNPNCRRMNPRRVPDEQMEIPELPREVSGLRIAMIADQMTYDCFSSACDCVALTCRDWANQMLRHRPHLFLCESAWQGNSEDGYCWRGQIYKNAAVGFENRKTVLDILAFCKKQGIPTVFFNKEDPTSFDDPTHNFTDLAVKFDYVYTTAAECVERYYALGAKFCACMQMGVPLKYYNPLHDGGALPYGAVFAGSWFAEFPERCRDMEDLFEQVKRWHVPLTIYDRNYGTSNPLKKFPEKYKDILNPAIPYAQLGDTLKDYEIALNINTVKDSETMFARRVFEVMALGLYVVSNPSVGLKKTFGENMSFTGETLPDKRRRDQAILHNIDYVLSHHSYESRLHQICSDIGWEVPLPQYKIDCIRRGDLCGHGLFDYYYIGEADEEILQQAARHFMYLRRYPGTGILPFGKAPYFVREPYEGNGEGILYYGNLLPEYVITLGMQR